jgi:hypothetical protein
MDGGVTASLPSWVFIVIQLGGLINAQIGGQLGSKPESICLPIGLSH